MSYTPRPEDLEDIPAPREWNHVADGMAWPSPGPVGIISSAGFDSISLYPTPEECRVWRAQIGFDGSVSDDGTVLRGCTEDGYRFTIGTWVRPTGDELQVWLSEHPSELRWRVIRSEVDERVALRAAPVFRRVGLAVDP